VVPPAGSPKNRAAVLLDVLENLLDARHVLLQAEIIFGVTPRADA